MTMVNFAVATKLSRTSTTRGSMTPPLPSPPSTAPTASIRSTTFASPTADTWQGTPCRAAIRAAIMLVEQLTTIAPGDFVLCDQLIDKTNRRPLSYFGQGVVGHVGGRTSLFP